MTNKERILVYMKLLEKYTGKKVTFLKEADEAAKNQAVNNLQFVQTSLDNSIDKINELYDVPVLNDERSALLNQISNMIGKVQDKVDQLIENITGVVSEEQEEVLDEDVSMSTDDIIKNPQAVKKLTDKKIDIKVKDKNIGTTSF